MITYIVENAILFFDDHDELYWNVTGNYWSSTIRNASPKVMLEADDISKELRASCYTGVYGSRESICGYKIFNNIGEFYSEKVLNPGEEFTVVLDGIKDLYHLHQNLREYYG